MNTQALDELFREQQTYILIYQGVETVLDPFEKNVSTAYLNPLPIQGIVNDIIFSKVQYAMPGIVTDRAKEMVVDKKYKSLIELSTKIQVQGESDYYDGWRVNGKLQYRTEGEYLRVYIYVKKDQ